MVGDVAGRKGKAKKLLKKNEIKLEVVVTSEWDGLSELSGL